MVMERCIVARKAILKIVKMEEKKFINLTLYAEMLTLHNYQRARRNIAALSLKNTCNTCRPSM